MLPHHARAADCLPPKVMQKMLLLQDYVPSIVIESTGYWLIIYEREYSSVMIALSSDIACVVSMGYISRYRKQEI